MKTNPKISVLIASRKNSKFLAKFIHALMSNTSRLEDIEVLCMYSAQDTWNKELIGNFGGLFQFYPEDKKLGRSGLHVYFNELLKHATGDWVIYFCDDHCIISQGWDLYLLNFAADRKLDPQKIYSIIPAWDNAGAMNQMLSRGYINALGNIGRFGNIDSYNNFVAMAIQGRIAQATKPIFHDFTHDPSVMTPEHNIVEGYSPDPEMWEDQSVKDRIAEDQRILKEAIANEL